MTSLIIFSSVIASAYFLPFFLLFIYQNKAKLENKIPIYIIDSNLFNSYAFCLGLFNSKTIFINSKFAKILDELKNEKHFDMKKALIEHEIAHYSRKHNELYIFITALKLAVIAQILVFFIPFWLMILSVLTYYFLTILIDNITKKIFHNMEYIADIYAYMELGNISTMLNLYQIMTHFRENARTPSIANRITNLSNFELKNKKHEN